MESAVRTAVLVMSTLRRIHYIEWRSVMLDEQRTVRMLIGRSGADRKRVIGAELRQ
jgi:hypothetical protein